jgi:Tetracyclin repressor-like, C-terminal domain
MTKTNRTVFRRRRRRTNSVTTGRIPLGPNTARRAEWLFALLRPARIPDRAAARAGDLIALYTGAYAFEESLPFPNPGGDEASPQDIGTMIRDYFAALPAGAVPEHG